MKYIFVLAQIKKCPSVIQWGWLVNSQEALERFIEIKVNGLTKEYMQMKTMEKPGSHYASEVQWGIDFTLHYYDQNSKNKKRTSIIDDSNILHNKFIEPVIKLYLRDGALLAWQNMFSLAPISGYKYLKTITKDTLKFPETSYTEKDIKITQWKGGTHYYAKVGSTEIEHNGEKKFNTYEEANKYAKKFIKET